jgi:hypothetical protein
LSAAPPDPGTQTIVPGVIMPPAAPPPPRVPHVYPLRQSLDAVQLM